MYPSWLARILLPQGAIKWSMTISNHRARKLLRSGSNWACILLLRRDSPSKMGPHQHTHTQYQKPPPHMEHERRNVRKQATAWKEHMRPTCEPWRIQLVAEHAKPEVQTTSHAHLGVGQNRGTHCLKWVALFWCPAKTTPKGVP